MRASRAFALGLVLVIAALGSWWFINQRRPAQTASITVYYTSTDGAKLVPWRVSLGPARDRKSVAFYAAVQAVAGPPAGTDAVRFPNGTRVLAADIDGSTVDVNLSDDVGRHVEGSFTEAAEFKALVYTLTGLPGIDAVRVRIAGRRVATLPGGHLELDEPLSRTSF
jgi:spore germination protein GerM